MSEEIENILGNINFEVETENEWVEPLGLDKDTWKQILNYITNLQQENKQLKEKINKAIEYIHSNKLNETTTMILGVVMVDLLEILGDKERK